MSLYLDSPLSIDELKNLVESDVVGCIGVRDVSVRPADHAYIIEWFDSDAEDLERRIRWCISRAVPDGRDFIDIGVSPYPESLVRPMCQKLLDEDGLETTVRDVFTIRIFLQNRDASIVADEMEAEGPGACLCLDKFSGPAADRIASVLKARGHTVTRDWCLLVMDEHGPADAPSAPNAPL
jgi:hypothetical protein